MEHLKQRLKDLSEYSFVLGVIDNDERRESKDITNSELLMVHEFGSPLRGIPRRPVLEKTIEASEKLVFDAINRCVSIILSDGPVANVKLELERTAMRIESIARKRLKDGSFNFAKLKPHTIKRKRSDVPLFDTGQLSRSIVCIVTKEKIKGGQ